MAVAVGALLVPGLLAGVVAIGATVAIERLGGRTGGLLATLPTTIVPASLGIWSASTDTEAFAAAMCSVPSGMLLDVGFLWLWRVVPPRLPPWLGLHQRLAAMTTLAIGAWLAGAVLVVTGQASLRGAGLLAVAGISLTAVIPAAGAAACLRNPPAPRGDRAVGLGVLLLRGGFAATAITAAVWLAAIGGPLAAGVASVFPAIFLTTMVSLWLAQGEAVQAGAVGPMMLGAGSVAAYAVLCAWTFPSLGPAVGASVAWVGAVALVTVPAWAWLRSLDDRGGRPDMRDAGRRA